MKFTDNRAAIPLKCGAAALERIVLDPARPEAVLSLFTDNNETFHLSTDDTKKVYEFLKEFYETK